MKRYPLVDALLRPILRVALPRAAGLCASGEEQRVSIRPHLRSRRPAFGPGLPAEPLRSRGHTQPQRG
jgi:hypothetical protein